MTKCWISGWKSQTLAENEKFYPETSNFGLKVLNFGPKISDFRLKSLNFTLKLQNLGFPTQFSLQKRYFWEYWDLKMFSLGLKIPILLLKKVNLRPKIRNFYLRASNFVLKTLSFGLKLSNFRLKIPFFDLETQILRLPMFFLFYSLSILRPKNAKFTLQTSVAAEKELISDQNSQISSWKLRIWGWSSGPNPWIWGVRPRILESQAWIWGFSPKFDFQSWIWGVRPRI